MRMPTHVVIDTRDGWTWSHSKIGEPFTESTATTFADLLNDACKPEHRTYIVAAVTPVMSPELMVALIKSADDSVKAIEACAAIEAVTGFKATYDPGKVTRAVCPLCQSPVNRDGSCSRSCAGVGDG